ncbi:hypothetical protein NDU88_008431 [Pleurodeles waltl]|uniref:Endonuclease/exonuclease/phosphatase domain-containing protein n=1 Tax=Pleurodeles waltl TaxID=8319 RepID=A0AAV7NZB8_PLEWA|nr:hypothetical protein NDU88_008431 [Pleurodeles waltl]
MRRQITTLRQQHQCLTLTERRTSLQQKLKSRAKNALVLGDFNLHLNDHADPTIVDFTNYMQSLDWHSGDNTPSHRAGHRAEPAASSDGTSGGGAWARAEGVRRRQDQSGGGAGTRNVPALSGCPGDLAGAVELGRPRAAWEVGPRSRAAGGGSEHGTLLESADDAYKIWDPRWRQ